MRANRISVASFIVMLISVASLSAADSEIPNTPRGFESQYQELFKACKKSDEAKIQELLADYAIPQTWFTNIFGAEKGAEIEEQYALQHKLFVSSTLSKLRGFDKADTSVYTKLSSDSEPKPAPAPPPESLKPIPLSQKYEIHYSTQGTERSTWMHSFIYVDGRFRYFGPGAYPFWDPPNIRLANPCGGPPSGQLIHRVEAVYPKRHSKNTSKDL